MVFFCRKDGHCFFWTHCCFSGTTGASNRNLWLWAPAGAFQRDGSGRRQCSRDLKPHETLYWGGLWEVNHRSSLMLESLSTSAGALPVLGTRPSSKAFRTGSARKFSHQTPEQDCVFLSLHSYPVPHRANKHRLNEWRNEWSNEQTFCPVCEVGGTVFLCRKAVAGAAWDAAIPTSQACWDRAWSACALWSVGDLGTWEGWGRAAG